MKEKLKIIIGIMLISIILVSGCAQNMTGHVIAEKETITIGLIGPLSGSDTAIGEPFIKGIKLAQKEISETKYNYKFIFENDEGDVKQSVSAYKKLKNVNNVDAIIGVFSPQGNALAPLVEQDKVLYCDVASDNNIVKNRKYTFLHWVSPTTEAKKYADEIEKLGYKKIISFESMMSGVTSVSNEVKIELKNRGIEFETHQFEKTDKDFRTVLAKIKNKEFDAFLFMLFPGHSAAGLQQIKEAGFEHPITSIEFFEFYTAEELDLLERKEDWYIFSTDPTNNFINKFSVEYPGETPSIAPYGYDCTNIIIQAFETMGKEKAIEWIHSLSDYDGAVGNLYYENGRIESPAAVKKVVDGKFVTA